MAEKFRMDGFVVEGLNETLKSLRVIGKEGQADLRLEVQKVAEKHADALRSAASSSSDSRIRGQAQSIKAAKDRVPTVTLGGAKKVAVSRLGEPPKAHEVLFGTEFGAEAGGPNDWRFPPKAKTYWLFETLKGRQKDLIADYQKVVDDIVKKWVN
jgi:hypothetical protein